MMLLRGTGSVPLTYSRSCSLRLFHASRTALSPPDGPPRRATLIPSFISKSLRLSPANGAPSSPLLPVPVPTEDAQAQVEVQKRVWEEAHREDGGPWLEKFIPVTRQGLVSRLEEEAEMLSPEERKRLGSLAAALDAFISRRFYAQLESMKVRVSPLGGKINVVPQAS